MTEDGWYISDIKNPWLKILLMWFLVIVLLPFVILIEGCCIILLASISEFFYQEKNSFSMVTDYFKRVFSPLIWQELWHNMTTWKFE